MSGTITWNQFEAIKMHVGTILEVADFPEARNPSWRLVIDFGEPIGLRKSSAQIKERYAKEDLLGRQIIAVTNFPPKQIATFMSECLVLGVTGEVGGVVLLSPDNVVANGKRIA